MPAAGGTALPVSAAGGTALPRAKSAPSPQEAQRRRRRAGPRGHACAATAARLRRGAAGGRQRRSLPSRRYSGADGALRSAGRGQLRRRPAAPTGHPRTGPHPARNTPADLSQVTAGVCCACASARLSAPVPVSAMAKRQALSAAAPALGVSVTENSNRCVF